MGACLDIRFLIPDRVRDHFSKFVRFGLCKDGRKRARGVQKAIGQHTNHVLMERTGHVRVVGLQPVKRNVIQHVNDSGCICNDGRRARISV